MARILCTGGAGFIGSHLVDRLINDGHEVVVIDNLSTGSINNLNPLQRLSAKFTFIDMDIKDRKGIELFNKNAVNFDFVFHLAAQINLRHSFDDPIADAEANIIGSLNIMNLAVSHKAKFIFTSTGGAMYATRKSSPWSETDRAAPTSPYGVSKFTVENYLKVYNKKHGLKYAAMRLANVYGPRQNHKGEAGVISIFINNIIEEQDLTIFGSGEQTRDFVYVDDVVAALMVPVRTGKAYGLLNVGTSEEVSINHIANLIIKKMWANRSVVYADAVPGELMESSLWARKLEELGWKPEVSLDDGIERTIKYFAK